MILIEKNQRGRNPNEFSTQVRRGLSLWLVVLAFGVHTTQAQIWMPISGTANIITEASAENGGIAPGCAPAACHRMPTDPGATWAAPLGAAAAPPGALVASARAACTLDSNPGCNFSSVTNSSVKMSAAGAVATIRWSIRSKAFHNCDETDQCFDHPPVIPLEPEYQAWAKGILDATLTLQPSAVPPNTVVSYAWRVVAQSTSKSEIPNPVPPPLGEDEETSLSRTRFQLTFNGVNNDIYNGDFDSSDIVQSMILMPPRQFGSFPLNGAGPITITLSADTRAEINHPGKGPFHEDLAVAYLFCELTLYLRGPNDPPIPPEESVGVEGKVIEFSIDIGGDREWSDHQQDGDEILDPGDIYLRTFPPATEPAACVPFRDDGTDLFASDPWPDPANPASRAPVCSTFVSAEMETNITPFYFDLDAVDVLDFSLTGGDLDPDPATEVIERFQSSCVPPGQHLMISFDDDYSTPFAFGSPTGCFSTPTGSPSDLDGLYGTSEDDDEVLGLFAQPIATWNTVDGAIPVPPSIPAIYYGIFDEFAFNNCLNTSPGSLSPGSDDDVEALDIHGIQTGSAECNTMYFSVDHEATAGLDPGAIYEDFPGGGFGLVVDPVQHLGLTAGTDIDAFEFVWTVQTDAPTPGTVVLTLLYSVAINDFLLNSAVDESGGLDPAMIYYSYLDGAPPKDFLGTVLTDGTFVPEPLPDNIDAITAWWTPLPPDGTQVCGNNIAETGEECDGTDDAACAGSCSFFDCTCSCSSDAECNDGDSCTADRCNFALGICVNDPVAPGTGCDDGSGCTFDDICLNSGLCAGTDVNGAGIGCAADADCQIATGLSAPTCVGNACQCSLGPNPPGAVPNLCVGGTNDGDVCVTDVDCPGGSCNVSGSGRSLVLVIPAPTPSGGTASNVAALTAFRVKLVSLYHPGNPQPVNQPDYSPSEGEFRYLNLLRKCTGMSPSTCLVNADCPSGQTCEVVTDCESSSAHGTTYPCASVGCTPEFVDWGALFGGVTVYVSGNAIIPDSVFTVAHLGPSCTVANAATCTDASSAVAFATARYGDTEPSGTVNVTDVVNVVDVVKQLPNALWEYQVYVRNPNPAPHIDATNVTDIVLHVDALKLVSYVLPLSACP